MVQNEMLLYDMLITSQSVPYCAQINYSYLSNLILQEENITEAESDLCSIDSLKSVIILSKECNII